MEPARATAAGTAPPARWGKGPSDCDAQPPDRTGGPAETGSRSRHPPPGGWRRTHGARSRSAPPSRPHIPSPMTFFPVTGFVRPGAALAVRSGTSPVRQCRRAGLTVNIIQRMKSRPSHEVAWSHGTSIAQQNRSQRNRSSAYERCVAADLPAACISARNTSTAPAGEPSASSSRNGRNTSSVAVTDPTSGTTSTARSRPPPSFIMQRTLGVAISPCRANRYQPRASSVNRPGRPPPPGPRSPRSTRPGTRSSTSRTRPPAHAVILSFRVRQGCDLRCPVVDSVADGTFAAWRAGFQLS